MVERQPTLCPVGLHPKQLQLIRRDGTAAALRKPLQSFQNQIPQPPDLERLLNTPLHQQFFQRQKDPVKLLLREGFQCR